MTTMSLPTRQVPTARLASLTQMLSDSQLRADASVRQYQTWLSDKSAAYHRLEATVWTWRTATVVLSIIVIVQAVALLVVL